jgi:DNA repair exonuclease SbcCD nuclease subunit
VSSFRFIHTGDIHLDSPLKGLAGQDGHAAELIRTATRTAFDGLVSQAIAEEVAFVVIAGDLYDGDWRDYQTGLFFVRQMGRLAKAGIPVFLLHGNHDAESQITRRLVLPENVRVFSSRRPQSFTLEEYGVVLHGQSFRQRDITDNLVSAYPEPVAGAFNVGVLHTGLGGMGGHANYAPCALADLVGKGYDYWALAHVHQAQVLCKTPHVVFCGNLQGRHIRETGPKGACLVHVEDGRLRDISPLHTDVVRWAVLTVAANGCLHITDLVDRLRQVIETAAAAAESRLIACRIELTGSTELHGQLLGSAEHLLAEARAAALAVGGGEAAWIERVVVSTRLPDDPETIALRKEALGDLRRILAEAPLDNDLRGQLTSDLGEFVRRLPPEVRADSEDTVLKALIDSDYDSLITYAGDYLAARLAMEGN